jgi:diguanylate cyclase (GGDEF)-like protein/PAS domain S-box-containing protein
MNEPGVTEALLALALETVSEGSLITNAARNTIYSNTAFTQITGYERSEILGVNCRILQGIDTSPEDLERMRVALDAAEVFQGTILNYRKDGTSFWNHLTITPLKNASGTLTNFVSVQRDVTDMVMERQKLSHEASHDHLTGLPNRLALRRHLRHEFTTAAEDGSIVAVGMIDLNDFKMVNDEHGHLSGDAVLTQFTDRVRGLIRRGDYFARLGGDEFVVVIPDLAPTDPTGELARVLKRVHTAVDSPFAVEAGASASIGMSVGTALFPSDGAASRELLRSADAALYRAKAAKGSGTWWAAARPEDIFSSAGAAEAMD